MYPRLVVPTGHWVETIYPYASKIEAVLQRETRELKTLLKISEAINYALNLATLAILLLGLISEAVPAEPGALLMLDEEDEVGDEFGLTFAWELKTGEGKEARVSSAIARQI